MKKIICILGIGLFLSQSVFCKKITKKNIPMAVKDSFNYKFPMMNKKFSIMGKVRWYTINGVQYYASFTKHGKDAVAIFSDEGKWVETSMEIEWEDIPSTVIATIKHLYPGYDIFDSEKVTTCNKSEYYRIELDNGDRGLFVIMSYNGGLLSETATPNY
jgi:hypothetical protein